jgi:hypothetical protein
MRREEVERRKKGGGDETGFDASGEGGPKRK